MKKRNLRKITRGVVRVLTVTLLASASTFSNVAAIEATSESSSEQSVSSPATTESTTATTSEQSTATTATDATNPTTNETTAETTETTVGQQLTILGTSDVHGQLWNWSYEDDRAKPVISTVVKNERAQNPQGTLLIDNGDMVQGTILTDDLYNNKPYVTSTPNPMIATMNTMNYDAMVLGNHEFNFGLDLIKKFKLKPTFPFYQPTSITKPMDAVSLTERPRKTAGS